MDPPQQTSCGSSSRSGSSWRSPAYASSRVLINTPRHGRENAPGGASVRRRPGQARRDAHAGSQAVVPEEDEAHSEASSFRAAGPRAPAAAALVVRGSWIRRRRARRAARRGGRRGGLLKSSAAAALDDDDDDDDRFAGRLVDHTMRGGPPTSRLILIARLPATRRRRRRRRPRRARRSRRRRFGGPVNRLGLRPWPATTARVRPARPRPRGARDVGGEGVPADAAADTAAGPAFRRHSGVAATIQKVTPFCHY